ncbi:MAG: type II secretion system protein [Candidatus Berkelbacteria bacterium]
MKSRGTKKAFTLVELLIVIAIISTVTAFIIFNVKGAQSRGRDSQRMADLASINDAINLYYRETGHYPSLPAGCGTRYSYPDGTSSWGNDASSANVTAWDTLSCHSANYIPGLAPKYIKKLPVDAGPSLVLASMPGNQRGYAYVHKIDPATKAECYKIVSLRPEKPALPTSKTIWDPPRDGGTDANVVDNNTPWAWSYYSRGCAFDNGGEPIAP